MFEFITAFAIGLVVLCLVGKVVSLPLHLVWKLITNSIVGAILLWFVKLVAVKVQITFLSALVAGFFGVPGVIGLLVGGLSAGFVLAIFMANSGGAWDNAKKYVEEGHLGGKGSECHKATVIGDTVGDPFKDTSGPSLNILIKLMSMVAIVMAGVTCMFSLL